MKDLFTMYTEQYEVLIDYLDVAEEIKRYRRIVNVPYCYDKDNPSACKQLHEQAFSIAANYLFWELESPGSIEYKNIEVNYC